MHELRFLRVAVASALLSACATPSQNFPLPAVSTDARRAEGAVPSPDTSAPPDVAASVGSYRVRTTLVIEDDGRSSTTFEEEYLLLSASPLRRFSLVEVEFDPAQSDRPSLRAEVTLPDGTIKKLDPSTVAEVPADGDGWRNLNDRRKLVAPLPALVAGSVVRRSWTRVTSRPVAPFAASWTLPLASFVPSERITAVVDHPRGLAPTMRVFAADVEPVREMSGDRVRVVYERIRPPVERFVGSLPPDAVRFAGLYVSTATSWQAVASGYAALVAPAIAPGPVRDLAAELRPASRAPRDVAAAALDWMHHNLRYTGLDLANGGIVPHLARETRERGYGDCKDLAAYLVALLRARDIDAKMVLVTSATWSEGPEDVPGLQDFDHAIVMVPGADPIWIDPTLRGMPAGVLADLTTSRRALVVDASTTAPIRTPEGDAARNRAMVHTEIELPLTGKGKVRTVRTQSGTALAATRQRAIWRTADEVRQEVADEVRESHASEDFEYRHSDPLSALVPFEEVLVVANSGAAVASDADAFATWVSRRSSP